MWTPWEVPLGQAPFPLWASASCSDLRRSLWLHKPPGTFQMCGNEWVRTPTYPPLAIDFPLREAPDLLGYCWALPGSPVAHSRLTPASLAQVLEELWIRVNRSHSVLRGENYSTLHSARHVPWTRHRAQGLGPCMFATLGRPGPPQKWP